MRKCLLIIFLFMLLIGKSEATGKRLFIDSVRVNSGRLSLDFHAEDMLDEKVVEGLQRGLTSTIEYQIELWEKRGKLINHLLGQRSIRLKVFYDPWEHKYVIMSPEEKRLTSSLETVRQRCSTVQNCELIAIDELKSKHRYFIEVKLILKPLSLENYQEIKHWLSGKAKDFKLNDLDDTQKQEQQFKRGLFRLFLALTGFGDRVISGRSPDFSVEDGMIRWDKQ